MIACITTTYFSFNLDGAPFGFVTCIRYLSRLLVNLKYNGKYVVLQLSPNPPFINHLLFVDYCILFSKVSIVVVKILMNCFEGFCELAGQSINYNKPPSFLQ